jgi:prepilin signal peptidase PulO-like enzyme (type II secretory pathway)
MALRSYCVLSRFGDGRHKRAGLGHAGVVLWGLDGRTVSLGSLAVVLAVALGAWAGTQAGIGAGVLASLAGLVAPAVLAVAIERRSRTAALLRQQQEVLAKYAPPGPADDGEDQGS